MDVSYGSFEQGLKQGNLFMANTLFGLFYSYFICEFFFHRMRFLPINWHVQVCVGEKKPQKTKKHFTSRCFSLLFQNGFLQLLNVYFCQQEHEGTKNH